MASDQDEVQVDSYFAPAERVSGEQLQREVLLARNPVVDSLLESVAGLLAVLNEQRQILAVNTALLERLGVTEADAVLGLRPGEAVQCIHATEMPGGCGTSRFCSTCNAAIAIVTSLATDSPVERECAITAQRNGKPADVYFQVRCCPIRVEGQRFLLLFLRDITAEQQRAALERVFFHDVGNLLGGLLFKSLLLKRRSSEPDERELASRVEQLASRLAKEIEVQRALSQEPQACQLTFQDVTLVRVIRELQETFANHPVSEGKTLSIAEPLLALQVHTDLAAASPGLDEHSNQCPGSHRTRRHRAALGGSRVGWGDVLCLEPAADPRGTGTTRLSTQFQHQVGPRTGLGHLCDASAWRDLFVRPGNFHHL